VHTDAQSRKARDRDLVDSTDRIRVVLDIERDERTISGELAVEGTPPMTFFGWLELIDWLERASAQGSPNPRAVPTDTHPKDLGDRADGGRR
jgi:hypothetical protein